MGKLESCWQHFWEKKVRSQARCWQWQRFHAILLFMRLDEVTADPSLLPARVLVRATGHSLGGVLAPRQQVGRGWPQAW